MSAIKINVSIDESLLERVDNFRDDFHLSRSALITTALVDYMNSRQVTPKIQDEAALFFSAMSQFFKGEISGQECERISMESAERLKAIKDSLPDSDIERVPKLLEE